jgi:predicted nucleic acid-binding protein
VSILLDTNVVSALDPAKPDHRVRELVVRYKPDAVFISVLTMGELRKGVALLPQGRKRAGLEQWLQDLERYYADRLLPVDLETSHIWGEIVARARSRGKSLPAIDGLIAATAVRHGLHVVTRNVGDFEPTGVLIINPWT